jgi:exopolyphosphatase/guanosine-5'-triphosphate,3'-diphosphate pyrophosphatase
MNIASIDIGTNTVLLLITQIDNSSNVKPLLNVYRMPRLGKDLHNTGYILAEKVELLINILIEFKDICKKYNCTNIIPFATQAMRSAKNSVEIIKEVHEKTGLKIEIISGEVEANLSYLGSISDAPKYENYTVIDIGGGSTEIIFGSTEKINFIKSFKLGVVTLTDQFFTDGYTATAVKNMEKLIDETFQFPFQFPANNCIISVAGTPTSLSCMSREIKIYKDEYVENTILEKTSILNLISKLKDLTPAEALQRFGEVLIGREDLILTGAIILYILLEKLNSDKTIVSTRGLRYGIINHFLTDLKRKK